MVSFLGVIAGCHSSVLWLWGGRVTANFGGVDMVPLLGAIVVRYGGGWGGWQPTLVEWLAIARCHSSVLRLGGRVANFGGVDVVPLLGAIAGCHCSEVWWGLGRLTTNFGRVAGHCRVPF